MADANHFVSYFPMTVSELMILNQLLCLVLGRQVYCAVPEFTYKSTFHLCVEYFCHVWSDAMTILDKIKQDFKKHDLVAFTFLQRTKF